MIGQTISHYRILDKLGTGGMGVVYRAEDVRLGRPVALKFLPQELVENQAARARFLLEAQSASALDHPNICTIYEVDQMEDERLFIAMALYDGETLERRMERGPLSVQEAAEIAIQVTLGLGKAHQEGIVHRDVKPANLMLTQDGQLKILDFGVAKLAGTARLTEAGTAIGTVSYMSPEQVRTGDLDHRSDLWSLAVVIYEMVTGRLPFTAKEAVAVAQSILLDQPEPLVGSPDSEIARLGEILNRSLQKDPARRFQSAREMGDALRHLLGRTVGANLARSAVIPMPRPQTSIAVLPFVDLSPEQDQEYFCFGMAEELIHLLSRLPGLRVASRTSAFQFLGKAGDIRVIGQKLGVDQLLEGSIRKAGERVRITVQLIKVSDGYHVWSGKYDGEMKDLFALQDDIAGKIADSLEGTLMESLTGVVSSPAAPPRASRAHGNLDAYNLYLKGRYYWNRRTEEGLRKGIEFFQQALELEPDYARAYAGLADSYAVLGIYGAQPPREVMPLAQSAAQRALELDENLAAVYPSRACVRAAFEGDFAGAAKDFQRAIELDPLYAMAYHGYAMYCLIPRGLFGDARVQLERARSLDPLSLAIGSSVGLLHYFSRHFGEAVEEYRKTLEIDDGFAMAHFFLGQTYDRQERFGAAVASLRQAIQLSGESPEMLAALAQATARAGDEAEARRLLGVLEEAAAERYVSPTLRAQVHVVLGEPEQAFAALEEAWELRAADLIWLGVRPVFDPLRGHDRFQRLLERIGLKPTGRGNETTESV